MQYDMTCEISNNFFVLGTVQEHQSIRNNFKEAGTEIKQVILARKKIENKLSVSL